MIMQSETAWPAFFADVVGLFVVGTIWVNRHLMFNAMIQVGRWILAFDLVLLLFVCTIPFATSQLAEFLTAGGQNLQVAVVIYGAVAEGMSISFTLNLRHVVDAGLTSPTRRPESGRCSLRVRPSRLVVFVIECGCSSR